jgi:SPP1 family predicted phage head-tail adaptor
MIEIDIPRRFPHFISLEQPTVTRGADGSEVKLWATFVQCAALIDTIGGREFFVARQTGADLSHQVNIRWQAGIAPSMRVNWFDPMNNLTRYLNIERVINPDESKRFLQLWCREILGRETQE